MDALLAKAKNIHTIKEATDLLYKYIPSDVAIVHKALDLAISAHEGQKRKSGESYIIHPILVAAITASISGDEMMVVAALLHDVIEDTDYTRDDIEDIFGKDIVHMVEGLTKIVQIRDRKKDFFYL